MADSVKDIIIAVICSGAFFSFIQYMINRWDSKRGIEKKVDSLSENFDEYKATLARTHILRFSDELHNNLFHSKDYFTQTIADIDTYEKYCEKHPNFSNGLTVMASEYIKEEYRKRYFNDTEENSK